MSSWNATVGWWLAALSLLMFFVSIGLAWLIIVRMPVDYLTRERETGFRSRHPLVRLVLVIVKNMIGASFLATGLVMLVTPGQGLLFMFIGLTMLDVPGKRRLIRRMLNNRRVLNGINRIRKRANRPPLQVFEPADGSGN